MIFLGILTICLLVGTLWGGTRAVRGRRGDQWGFWSLFLVWFLALGIGVNFFIFFLISMTVTPNTPHHDYRALASISSLVDAKKPYYLGVNYEDGDRVVNYIDNGKHVTTLSHVSEGDDEFKIFYDNSGQAKVDVVTFTSEYWIVAPWPLLIDGSKNVPVYEFHVPSGTVLEDFKIK